MWSIEFTRPEDKEPAACDMRCGTWIYPQQKKNQLNLTAVCICVMQRQRVQKKTAAEVILKVTSAPTLHRASNSPDRTDSKSQTCRSHMWICIQAFQFVLTYLECQMGGMCRVQNCRHRDNISANLLVTYWVRSLMGEYPNKTVQREGLLSFFNNQTTRSRDFTVSRSKSPWLHFSPILVHATNTYTTTTITAVNWKMFVLKLKSICVF